MRARHEHRKRASVATTCLERAWTKLRQIDERFPPAVLVILSAGDRRWRLGHCVRSTWKHPRAGSLHEIGISPELFSSAEEALAVLLHEGAHAILFEEDGDGGCTGAYYHRKEFRDTCRTLGLSCRFKNTRKGWTLTDWPETGAPGKYEEVLVALRQLPLGTGHRVPHDGQPTPGRPTPAWGLKKLVCRCETGRAIWACKSVANDGGILCAMCGQPFASGPEQ